jgi:spermidine synthase
MAATLIAITNPPSASKKWPAESKPNANTPLHLPPPLAAGNIPTSMAAKQKPKPRTPLEPEAKPAHASVVAPSTQATSLLPAAFGLKLLVFVSGAVLLGLEIVGSRVLAPYFGNSVFVWGSLISLFLIALSLGYYVGGGLSDRRPSQRLLNGIVIAVAAWMFLIAVIAAPVCDALLTSGFGEKSGPFLAATILFLLPSIGMGMVSPFAIRLATHTVASVGKTAGTLYALSTLGSIVGTVLTTFVLIPSFGAVAILKGLAFALLLAALATFPFRTAGAALRNSAAMLGIAAACLLFLNGSKASLPQGVELVRELNTPYHHITVLDNKIENQRQLQFDRYTESQVSLDPPYLPPQPYYTRYFNLAFLAKPQIHRTLFIGAGGGVGPRAFHMHDPAMELDVVDIAQKVLDVAREDFHLEPAPQIRLIADDGRTFVRNAPDGSYDSIVLDAFTIGGRIPFHLVTREFFELCRQKLSPGGGFVMNINSAVQGPNSAIFQSMYQTLDEAFPSVYAFAYGSQFGVRDRSTNIILVATNSNELVSPEAWTARAQAYQSASYVDSNQIQQMVKDLLQTLPDMQHAATFTDDYAPIETMAF